MREKKGEKKKKKENKIKEKEKVVLEKTHAKDFRLLGYIHPTLTAPLGPKRRIGSTGRLVTSLLLYRRTQRM